VGLDPWATGSAILPAFRRAGRWFRRKELREAAAEEESGGCIVGLAAVVCWLEVEAVGPWPAAVVRSVR